MIKKKTDPEKVKRIRELAAEGNMTIREIANDVGLAEGTVAKYVADYRRETGTLLINQNRKHLPKELVAEILEHVKAGESYKSIAERFGVRVKAVQYHASKIGIKRRSYTEFTPKVEKCFEDASNADRSLCVRCIYRHKDKATNKGISPVGCDYLIHADEPRGCPVEVCDKFVEGERLTTDERTIAIAEAQKKNAQRKRLVKQATRNRADIRRVLEQIGKGD